MAHPVLLSHLADGSATIIKGAFETYDGDANDLSLHSYISPTGDVSGWDEGYLAALEAAGLDPKHCALTDVSSLDIPTNERTCKSSPQYEVWKRLKRAKAQ